MSQINQPVERNDGDSGSVSIYPVCSTAVPAPESNVTEPNTSPLPEPVEPLQNMSIPAATVQSKIAFDELGGLLSWQHITAASKYFE